MTLRVTVTGVSGGDVHFDAAPGGWVSLSHPQPGAVVAAIGGVGPGDVVIELDGEDLSSSTAVQRHAARLCTSGCRLDPLPALRVADVIGLGLRAPQPPLWQTLLGTARARMSSADDEAQVRALAGRVGLARWVDRTAVSLPLRVEALVDLTRALAGLPKVLVWRRPEWLDPVSLGAVTETVMAEQRLGGFTVVEFAQGRAASLVDP